MKLRETSGEFENVKHSSAQDKLNFAEKRVSSLHHQHDILKNLIVSKYTDRQLGTRYEDIKDDERAKGHVSFPTTDTRGNKRFAVFHSLTPADIQTLTRWYTKANMLYMMMIKIEKGLSALRLKVKKETGTYVSREQMNTYEATLGKEICDVVEKTMSNVKMAFSYSRTRQNGSSHVYLKMEDTAKPGALDKADKKTWKVFLEQIKYTIRTWLETKGMKDYVTMRFEHYSKYLPKDPSKPPHAVDNPSRPVKSRSGEFNVAVESKDMVAYFRGKVTK